MLRSMLRSMLISVLRRSRLALFAAAGLGALAASAAAQSPLRARADNGREVILRSDGTWTFADPPAAQSPAVPPPAARPPVPSPVAAPLPPSPLPPTQFPSVRSLVTPPAAPGNPSPVQSPVTPAVPVRSAAPTVTPGAGQPLIAPPAAATPAAAKTAAPLRPAAVPPTAQPVGVPAAVQRPRTATATLDTSRGGFRVWYNPANWRPTPATADGRVEFRQTNGQGVVVVIPEGTPLPLVALRTAAVENARRSAPDARIVAEQTRRIGNRDVLLLQINATLTTGNQAVTYFGHYFGDPKGSIQVVGAVDQREFERLRPLILEFLDGLDLNRP